MQKVIPLVLLLLFVAVLAAIGYVVYTIARDVSKNTREKMERKHVLFTKDGMKVEMKQMEDEQYKDRTQRYRSSEIFSRGAEYVLTGCVSACS